MILVTGAGGTVGRERAGALAAGNPLEEADALVDLAALVTAAVCDVAGRPPIPFEQFAHDYAAALR